MSGKKIGYIRVSTLDQNPDRQLEGIDLDKKFVDYATGISTIRPQLQSMLEYAREDDIIYVHSMDRLARNIFDLKKMVNELVSRKIHITFMKENLTFSDQSNAMSNLLLHVMGAFAEFEYAFIKERQLEGIAIAKAQGKYRGGKTKLTQDVKESIIKDLQTRKNKSNIAKSLGISRPSLYRYMQALGIKNQ